MLLDDLQAARGDTEAVMGDTCVITTPSGAPVFDDATGTYTTPAPTELYTGKCEFRIRNIAAQTPEYGGREVTVEQSVVAIPVSAPEIPPGATVTCTAVAAWSDPALVGSEFTVRGGGKGSRITARRLNVEEVTSG